MKNIVLNIVAFSWTASEVILGLVLLVWKSLQARLSAHSSQARVRMLLNTRNKYNLESLVMGQLHKLHYPLGIPLHWLIFQDIALLHDLQELKQPWF